MLTFASFFVMAYYIITMFLGALFLAADGFMNLMVLLCLAFGAVALFVKKRWAWTPCILALLASVAIEVLAPFQSMLQILGALAAAIALTAIVKHHINDMLRRDAARPVAIGGPRFSPTMRTLLRVI